MAGTAPIMTSQMEQGSYLGLFALGRCLSPIQVWKPQLSVGCVGGTLEVHSVQAMDPGLCPGEGTNWLCRGPSLPPGTRKCLLDSP